MVGVSKSLGIGAASTHFTLLVSDVGVVGLLVSVWVCFGVVVVEVVEDGVVGGVVLAGVMGVLSRSGEALCVLF